MSEFDVAWGTWCKFEMAVEEELHEPLEDDEDEDEFDDNDELAIELW